MSASSPVHNQVAETSASTQTSKDITASNPAAKTTITSPGKTQNNLDKSRSLKVSL
jgi:hypothetical protein